MRKKPDRLLLPILLLALPLEAAAQGPPPLQQVIDRLARIEQENERLRAELAEVRAQLDALRAAPAPTPPPSVEERLEIAERRIDEQAQTKVETSQRLPVRFTGVLVANLFHNARPSFGYDTPTTASSSSTARSTAGLSFRQTQLGFEYTGADSVLGAKVRGAVSMDFYEGPVEAGSGYSPTRLRTASLGLDWTNTSLAFGVDKPIFSPRDPMSFAYLGVPPLTSAGNLWRWQPQVRLEHRFQLGASSRLRAQAALFQTYEEIGSDSAASAGISRRRPALQGRAEYSHSFGERRFEIAPAFHISTTRLPGASIPSRLFSLDWFFSPSPKLEVSGAFFTGSNIHHLGALRQGFVLHDDGSLRAVHSRGGWTQFSFPLASRVTLNLFGGIHDDRNRDLREGIAANRTGAANVIFRIAPNVFLSLESLQTRTTYLGPGPYKSNRYDLAVAYLF